MRGEPDQTLPELASRPWSEVDGCCWRDDSGLHLSAALGVTDMKKLVATSAASPAMPPTIASSDSTILTPANSAINRAPSKRDSSAAPAKRPTMNSASDSVSSQAARCAPMPGTGGKLELPRHATDNALKGTRPVFFPDEGRTLPTRVWDRYALEPGVSIDGPAVFEENESTFIVGPNATARLLPDGSILAEAN